jgi:hypothetical protein
MSGDELMAKKKPTKKETKSDFLRKVLSKNPNLDYQQVNRRWAKAGHEGEISNPLYYKVRGELGIKTEWVWVKESGPESDEAVATIPERNASPNDDLVQAAEEVLPKILGFYNLFRDKRPIMEFDLQSQKIYAYPYEEYKATLSERSQAMLTTQYGEAVAKNKVVVFVRDNETRRLTSMSFHNH